MGSFDNTNSATATDEYATRHNPFVYFHGIIDDTTLCDSHVVGLDALTHDLGSPASIANYSFITPDLCSDGHDAPCKNGQPGGLTSANRFLQTWGPQITNTQTFREDGLLMIIFDEASSSDATSCCGAIPGPGSPMPGINGPGGGRTGAVLLSPCIAPGTMTNVPYNHYSMLGSVDVFGLSHIGYASLPGETTFGSDIYNRRCGAAPPTASISAPPLLSRVQTRSRIPVSWTASTAGGTGLASYTVAVSDLSARHLRFRTLLTSTRSTSLTYRGRLGHTYLFRVQAANLAGQTSAFATAVVLGRAASGPPGVATASAGGSTGASRPGRAGRSRARSRAPPSSCATAAARWRRSARAHRAAGGPGHLRRAAAQRGGHRLTITVVRGTVALEGLAISARRD